MTKNETLYIHLLYIQSMALSMEIEKEIKQKSFKSEYHKLAVNLSFTNSWLNMQYIKVFRSFGISQQQFNVLRILKGQYPNPSSLILIRERMMDKSSNASRLIDKLEAAGYTKRKQCPDNRRKVDITITEKGMKLLEEINPQVDKLKSTLGNLSIEEAKTLNQLLDKLRD